MRKTFQFSLVVLAISTLGCQKPKEKVFVSPERSTWVLDLKKYDGASWSDRIFIKSSFRETVIRDFRIQATTFQNSDLRGVQISGSTFQNFSFQESNLAGAKIHATRFQDGDFRQVSWKDAILTDVVFENCIFDSKDLDSAIQINVKMINPRFVSKNQ